MLKPTIEKNMMEADRFCFLAPDKINHSIEEINNAVTQPTRIQALLSMRNLIHKYWPVSKIRIRIPATTELLVLG